MSEGPRGPPSVPGDSGSCRRSHGIDHISRATRARVPVSAGPTTCPCRIAPPPMARGFDRHPGQIALVSEAPRSRPAGPVDSGPCPRSLGIDQISRATRARVPMPAGSTSCPCRLGPCSDGTRFRPALPGDSRSFPWDRSVDQLSWASREQMRHSAVWTRCPGRLGPGSDGPREPPTLLGDHLSRTTRNRVRDPAESTSCPVRPGPGSQVPGLDQMSRVTWAWAPVFAVSTSCPG